MGSARACTLPTCGRHGPACARPWSAAVRVRVRGEADDRRRIGGFAEPRRRASGPADARRLADCNPLHRVSWALLAAGPVMSVLCVLCVLCGSSRSQRQKQKGTTEDTENTERSKPKAGSRAPGSCGACRAAWPFVAQTPRRLPGSCCGRCGPRRQRSGCAGGVAVPRPRGHAPRRRRPVRGASGLSTQLAVQSGAIRRDRGLRSARGDPAAGRGAPVTPGGCCG